MSAADTSIPTPAPTPELHAAVEAALSEQAGPRLTLARLERRPSPYRSSFAIEELDLTLDDGRQLPLIWKDASRRALSADAVNAKPLFLHNPLREIDVYRLILGGNSLGTPRCCGTVIDPARDRYWLFLERINGLELTRIGDFSVWQDVSRWLARFHFHCAANPPSPDARRHLVIQDRGHMKQWIGRAIEFLAQRQPAVFASDVRCIDGLAERYDRVVDRLVELPTSVIHGDFFPSNVLIDRSASTMRICAIDWEMAGIGPCGLDLAALVAGRWTDEQRRALALAYWDESTTLNSTLTGRDEFLTDLECCRLHLAVQMLGWSATWRPQPEHAQDWLGEATRLASELRIA